MWLELPRVDFIPPRKAIIERYLCVAIYLESRYGVTLTGVWRWTSLLRNFPRDRKWFKRKTIPNKSFIKF